MTNSGRAVVIGLVVTAAATLVTVVIRERNKKTMFAMYADIHDLATSEVAYYTDHKTFTPNLGATYTPTHGATVHIAYANDTGYAATATHPGTSKVCYFTYAEPRMATPIQVLDARIAAWKAYNCK